MRLPDPSPVPEKNRVVMGPAILSSTGAGVWRKASTAFPDFSSALDKFQSASFGGPSKRLLHCDPGNPLEPPEPQKIKSDSKSDFRGFPQGGRKVTFLTPKQSHFWGQKGDCGGKKVTFGVTFRSPWGKPRKSLFESLLIFWGSGGSRGFPGSQCKSLLDGPPKLAD